MPAVPIITLLGRSSYTDLSDRCLLERDDLSISKCENDPWPSIGL